MKVRRPLLLPLVPLYAAGLAIKRQMTRWGWLGQRHLTSPVISVGSVSAGGAGKTPVVLMLAEMLERGGYAVKILTRGYGRRSTGVERVNPGGDARWFGDEPVLMAERAAGIGAEVFVAANRYEAGLLAERTAGSRMIVHLLDDGFQHGQLARDMEIVLLTKQDLEDSLLPAGDLREPLEALRHADVIVLREEESETTRAFAEELARGATHRPLIWVVQRRLMLTGKDVMPKLPVAFCGIARPEGFLKMLESERCQPVAKVIYEDHHAYNGQDVKRLVEQALAQGADGFCTTEKDAVKLTAGMRAQLEAIGPVVALRLHVELVDSKARMTELIGLLAQMERRRENAATLRRRRA